MKFKLEFPDGLMIDHYINKNTPLDVQHLIALDKSIISKIESKTLELDFLPPAGTSIDLVAYAKIFDFSKEEVSTLQDEAS